VAEATLRTYELARQYGVTVEGSVTWAFEFEDQPAFTGFRELATNGIDKPVLNVFRMLGMLGARKPGAEWIATESSAALPLAGLLEHGVTGPADVNAVATRNGGEIDVLLWNYHDADLPAPPTEIQLAVDRLHGKTVRAAEFRMDETHSNAYRVWQQMVSPAHPGTEQAAQLEKAGALEQSVPDHSIPVRAGLAEIDLEIPRQGVVLVRLVER
jgi:xylan 1,4-beta-xylosidase